MHGLKLGNFCIASFCVLASFYVIPILWLVRAVSHASFVCTACALLCGWPEHVKYCRLHAYKTLAYVPTYCLTALRVIQMIVNNSTTDVLFENL